MSYSDPLNHPKMTPKTTLKRPPNDPLIKLIKLLI